MLDTARGLVECGVLVHSFQSTDNTPDTQRTENDVRNQEQT